MNRRWICSDVWMDIFPSFDHAQLGLKLALLSYRFDALVAAHFDGKTTKLTIWRTIEINKDEGPEPKLSVWIAGTFVAFPMPDRPLPNKIRFKDLHIHYIDHSVIAFVRSNKHIWDRMGTKLELFIDGDETEDDQSICDIFCREIWPNFATNIRHLSFTNDDHLDSLRHGISPTILTDLDQLHSIDSTYLYPDVIADNGPTATVGQVLSKWLHMPSKNGQLKQRYHISELKRLHCHDYSDESNLEWINNFKETFHRATTSSSYIIQLNFYTTKMPNEPFELVNERTNEKLILWEKSEYAWMLIRCPGETVAVHWKENWDDNLNKVKFDLWPGNNKCIGPLSGSEEKEEKEKADESSEN